MQRGVPRDCAWSRRGGTELDQRRAEVTTGSGARRLTPPTTGATGRRPSRLVEEGGDQAQAVEEHAVDRDGRRRTGDECVDFLRRLVCTGPRVRCDTRVPLFGRQCRCHRAWWRSPGVGRSLGRWAGDWRRRHPQWSMAAALGTPTGRRGRRPRGEGGSERPMGQRACEHSEGQVRRWAHRRAPSPQAVCCRSAWPRLSGMERGRRGLPTRHDCNRPPGAYRSRTARRPTSTGLDGPHSHIIPLSIDRQICKERDSTWLLKILDTNIRLLTRVLASFLVWMACAARL